MSRDNVLYSIYNHNEWCIESEETVFRLPQSFNVSAWSILRAAGSLIKSNVNNVVFPLNQVFLRIKEFASDWRIDFHHATKILAIANEREVLLLPHENGFSTVIASHSVARDYNAKWALINWSPSGTYLILCSSKSQLTVFDKKLATLSSLSIFGGEMRNDDADTLNVFDTIDYGNCICAIEFKEDSQGLQIYCLSYRGMFNCFYFDTSLNDLAKFFAVNLGTHVLDGGVFSMVFSHMHGLFVTGSCFDRNAESSGKKSQSSGLQSWKLLDESPWLRSFSITDQKSAGSGRKSWFTSSLTSKGDRTENFDGAFRLVLSVDENSVFACNLYGSISQWSMPGLLPIRSITQNDICKTSSVESDFNPVKRQAPVSSDFLLESLGRLQMWGVDEAVLMKFSGILDIQNVATMESLIGKCEKFSPVSEITEVFTTDGEHKAFVGLEMEKKVSTVKRKFRLSDSSDNEDDDDDDSDDDERTETLKQRGSRYLKQGLYFVTESDHFQPPKKKPKLIKKLYRIFSFQSTTPEALFKIKLQNEEFGEALSLAKLFNLDSDLVYMRQWRKYPVSNATIQDYLRKISKRHWILRECVNRTSDDLDATKALLNYGLIGTEIEVIIDIGARGNVSESESKKAVYDLRIENDNENDDDDYLSRQAIAEKKSKLRKETVSKLLKEFKTVSSLDDEQREILRLRKRLIHYLQTLTLYEEVLGGAEKAAQNFSSDEFAKLRDQTWLKTTVDFAQSSDWQAVDTMFMYVEQLEMSRLLVLSNFPETMDISEYAELLPSLSDQGIVKGLFLNNQFENDWMDSDVIKGLFDEELKLVKIDCESLPEIIKPRPIASAICSDWFKWRAREIESCTGLMANAIELLKGGVDNQIPGLIQLLTDMQLLQAFVCEKQTNTLIELETFEAMSEFDKINLVVASSTPQTIAKDVRKFVKPRLNTLSGKKHDELFRQLLISLSMKSLEKLVTIFEASGPKCPDPLETNQMSLMRNAVDCIYNCPRTDQLSQAYAILNCLPLKSSGNFGASFDQIFEDLDSLEIHLEAASILNKFEVFKPVVFYMQVQFDKTESLKLLNELIGTLIKQDRKLSLDEWLNFLVHDLLQLQSKLMKKLSGQDCFTVFITQLLRADDSKLTKIGLRFMILSQSEKPRQFSYANATTFKLSFQESTDIILNVTQEFVDSSASVHDSSLLAAISLLKTVHNPPKSIQDEKDFIEMLTKLQNYSCSLLPVVIRTKYNFESLIRHLLKENVGAYTNWTKILKLATLFKTGSVLVSNEEKKSKVCAIIAECALNDNYIDLALEMCLQLIALKFRNAWKFCWELAKNEELKDLEVKLKLLSFAMLHCDDEVLPEVIKLNNVITKKVNKNYYEKSNSSENSSSEQIKLFPVLDTLEKTGKGLLKETQQTTQKLLGSQGVSFRGDSKSDKIDVSAIGASCFFDYDEVTAQSLRALELPVPELDECFLNLTRSQHFQQPNLNETSENVDKQIESLVNCAVQCFETDITLSLFFVLACNSEKAVNLVREKLKKSEKSLTFVVVAFAMLQKMNDESEKFDIFETIKTSPQFVIESELDKVSELTTPSNNSLVLALEDLQSFVESSKLGKLVVDVDTARFATDEQYKTETILNIAANTDSKLVGLSLELAERHKVDVSKVRLHTLAFILTNEKYSVSDIRSHLKSMNLLKELKEKPKDVVNLLESQVFPVINSTDYQKLLLFFEVLKSFDVLESQLCQKAGTHIDILTSVEKLAPKLPYKDILSQEMEMDPCEVIARYCNPNNYSGLSQVLARIPNPGKPVYRSRIVFHYASKLIFETSSESFAAEDQINLIKSCIDLMQFEDVKEFANLIAFQENEIRVTDLKSICVLVRKCLAVCRKNKKKTSKASIDICQDVEQIFQEVEKLNNAIFMKNWLTSGNEIKTRAAKAFWLSRGAAETQREILIGLVLAQIDFGDINESMESLSVEFGLNDVIETIMGRCMDDIASCQHIELAETSKPLVDVLTNVRERIDGDSDGSEKCLISEERIVKKLREVTCIPNLSTEAKIYILEKIEHLFNLNEEDLKSLLHARTRSLLENLFSESVFTEDDLGSEQGRYDLICDLLDCSVNSQQFAKLAELVDSWPAFKEYSGNQHPFVAIACKWIQTNEKEAIGELKPILRTKSSDFSMRQSLSAVLDFCLDSKLDECSVIFGLLIKSSIDHLQRIVEILNRENRAFQVSEESFVDIIEAEILPKLLEFQTNNYQIFRPSSDLFNSHKCSSLS
ncbi:NBAS subunit of NRZ tethering complex-like isoform X2 [Convolutriloba macropyga]|uniref:NBAS subunit of NRZ tethering complex-like isoform X2 n=1 Tax=Convolutriloba macropyga TaxID=536237 RepID=UPI003F523BC3